MEVVEPNILLPKFAVELRGSRYVDEGQTAHFQCEVENMHDPSQRIEFYHNGNELQSSPRHHKAFAFGHVSLDIHNCVLEDSGEYSVKLVNHFGQCTSTIFLTVTQIQELEIPEQKLFEGEISVPVTWQKPVFTQPLMKIYIGEGQTAHFECRLLPVGDPTLNVVWFREENLVEDCGRITKTHDLLRTGCVSMTIAHVCLEDEGVYTCRASNLLGIYETASELKIKRKQRPMFELEYPIGQKENSKSEAQRYPTRMETEEAKISPPKLSLELRGSTNVNEGQTARFRCQVEFVHDHNLSIEFYHNGKPLRSSARHHTSFVFGYVSLDIEHCIPEDAGVYSVEVTNAVGQCTSTVYLKVTSKDSIISTQSFKQVQEIQTVELSPSREIPATKQWPVFTQPLQKIYKIQEGHDANFECRLLPVGDPTLKVEWLKNEKLIKNNFNITKRHEFLRTSGYVSLSIAHVCKLDEGLYMCRAYNLFGQCVSTGEIKIRSKAARGRRGIIFKPQYPVGIKRIWQLEKQRRPTRMEIVEATSSSPQFALNFHGTRLALEGQTAHFRCQVENLRDPNLYIKFYHNGKPLLSSPRYNITFQYGYVSLDIQHCALMDSGEYSIQLFNDVGQCTSSTSMEVVTKGSIKFNTHSLQGLKNIRDVSSAEVFEQPKIPVPVKHRPVFTQQLKNTHCIHPVKGRIARLECTLYPVGDPSLKVEWYRNIALIEESERITKTYDPRTGCLSITIAHIQDEDEGIYTCRASNRFGACMTTCMMKTKEAAKAVEPQLLEDLKKMHQRKQKREAKPSRWSQHVDLRLNRSLMNKVEAKPKSVCIVCGDTASGKQYELPSCGDCRRFFNRSIKQNLGYVCKKNGSCDVGVNRKKLKCQACRFSKCLNAKFKIDSTGTSSCRLVPGGLI